LTYSIGQTLSESAAGAGGTYFFRLNSPYDPDATGVGLSAFGYATWSAIYQNYRVLRSTIRLQGSATVASGGFANVTLAPTLNPTVPANKATWKAIPFAQTRTLTPQVNGGVNTVRMTMSPPLHSVAHVTRSQFVTDYDYTGQVGSNPGRQIYLALGFDSINSATAGTLAFYIQITFEVEWFNPFPLQ
jgi:hypothetical protein